jgi:uncharacterized caspase-like protein
MTSEEYKSSYSNSWALIIGINQYSNASPLDYATNDATAVADILENKFNFPKTNITLLIDGEATSEAIKKTFFEYTKNSIQPNDIQMTLVPLLDGTT